LLRRLARESLTPAPGFLPPLNHNGTATSLDNETGDSDEGGVNNEIGSRISQVTYTRPTILTSPYDPAKVLPPLVIKLPTLEPTYFNGTGDSHEATFDLSAVLPPLVTKLPTLEPDPNNVTATYFNRTATSFNRSYPEAP